MSAICRYRRGRHRNRGDYTGRLPIAMGCIRAYCGSRAMTLPNKVAPSHVRVVFRSGCLKSRRWRKVGWTVPDRSLSPRRKTGPSDRIEITFSLRKQADIRDGHIPMANVRMLRIRDARAIQRVSQWQLIYQRADDAQPALRGEHCVSLPMRQCALPCGHPPGADILPPFP